MLQPACKLRVNQFSSIYFKLLETYTVNILEQQPYQRNYAQLQDMFDYTCDFSLET